MPSIARFNRTGIKQAICLTSIALLQGSTAAHAFTFSDLYKTGFETLNKQIYRATGSLRICAANEVKAWVASDVVPVFRDSEKAVSISERDLIFNGSGELADNWNANNRDKCDVIILGSDVSALRAADFDRTKSINLAYSPTIFVGLKDKFAAAAARFQVGKLAIEMSTSNSGQTGYISCVYSELNAESPKEVEVALDGAGGEKKQADLRDFMSTVIFEQTSSSKIKDLFISGDGMGVGAAHLAIATYESYLPEITKAAAANNIAIETIYPAISILNNFPAFIIAKEGTPAFDSAKAFLQLATSARIQQQLLKYGLRPAQKGIPLAPYMNMKIEVGDSPRNRRDLRRLWDVVGQVETIRSAGILEFPQ
jgi:hypothetical protein